jgi:hypothetical protein
MPRPPKPDITDDPQPRPPAEPLDDAATMQKLARVKVGEIEDGDAVQAKLERIPESKRQEASKALKSRIRRMRSFVYNGEDEGW